MYIRYAFHPLISEVALHALSGIDWDKQCIYRPPPLYPPCLYLVMEQEWKQIYVEEGHVQFSGGTRRDSEGVGNSDDIFVCKLW